MAEELGLRPQALETLGGAEREGEAVKVLEAAAEPGSHSLSTSLPVHGPLAIACLSPCLSPLPGLPVTIRLVFPAPCRPLLSYLALAPATVHLAAWLGGCSWEVGSAQARAQRPSHTVSPQDPAAEARMKVACITEQVLTLVNRRLGLYRHFDETVNRYKQSRDVSTLNSGKKSLETEHKALTSEVALLQSRLKTEGSDLCDKVSACRRRSPGLFLPRSLWPAV